MIGQHTGLHTCFLAVAALAAAIAGFAALSLAMDRHWEQLHGRWSEPAIPARQWLRAGGTLGLLVSLGACIALRGAAQGWVTWAGMLTLAGVALALTLSYAARGVARLGWGMACTAAAAAAAAVCLPV
jgi:hypothetical protein